MPDNPLFNLVEASVADDLAGLYNSLRGDGSEAVVQAEPIIGCEYRAVIGYQAVRRAAGNPGELSSAAGGAVIPPVNFPLPLLPVELDPPEHRKYRRLLIPELRPERVASWSDAIRRETDRALDQFTEAGEGDLTTVAHHVPPAIIAAVLGVPDDGPLMVDITTRLFRATVNEDTVGHAAASRELMVYLDAAVTAAEGSGRDDLLGTVANAVIDGEPIGHDVAVATTLTLILAGQETTVNGIASMLALLGRLPHVKRALIEDPALIPAAVEETLRMEAPVQLLGRTAVADTEIDGCPVHEGERLGLVWGAANLDPAEFEHPEEFRLDRENAGSHVTFGHGIHRCVGEHLARAEMMLATERVLARIPDYELAGPVEHWTSLPTNRGVRRLLVRFTPSPRVL